MSKPKLQKKWINWYLSQYDIHIRDHVQQCREGYTDQKTWEKPRHAKKQLKKQGLWDMPEATEKVMQELCG